MPEDTFFRYEYFSNAQDDRFNSHCLINKNVIVHFKYVISTLIKTFELIKDLCVSDYIHTQMYVCTFSDMPKIIMVYLSSIVKDTPSQAFNVQKFNMASIPPGEMLSHAISIAVHNSFMSANIPFHDIMSDKRSDNTIPL